MGANILDHLEPILRSRHPRANIRRVDKNVLWFEGLCISYNSFKRQTPRIELSGSNWFTLTIMPTKRLSSKNPRLMVYLLAACERAARCRKV